MKIRISSLLFAVLLGISLSFSGCNKYDEGPGISLSSPEARLEREWKVTKATDTNGALSVDVTSNYAEDTYEFGDDGVFIINLVDGGTTLTYTGTWGLDDDKAVITTSYNITIIISINVTEQYTILRLTKKDMVLEFTNESTGTVTRLELEPA